MPKYSNLFPLLGACVNVRTGGKSLIIFFQQILEQTGCYQRGMANSNVNFLPVAWEPL